MAEKGGGDRDAAPRKQGGGGRPLCDRELMPRAHGELAVKRGEHLLSRGSDGMCKGPEVGKRLAW